MKLILGLLLLLVPLSSFAVSTSFIIPEDTIRVGDMFVVEVFLDTEQDNINALEGVVTFMGGLELEEIRYSGSIISIWVTKPSERSSGVVDFAGIIPGGYQASPEKVGRGNLFTLVFKATEKGDASITIKPESKSYLNDGEGTEVLIKESTKQFSIGATEGEFKQSGISNDMFPPEDFTPYIVSGDLYDLKGKVLVFDTIDKDSGISKYEVTRSVIGFMSERSLTWIESTSPYLLQDGDEYLYLYVRATDQAGNVRIEVVSPERQSAGVFVLSMCLLVFLIVIPTLLYIRHRASVSKR